METLTSMKDIGTFPATSRILTAIKQAQGDPSEALKELSGMPIYGLSIKLAGYEADERTGGIDRERAEITCKAQMALHRPAAALRFLIDAARCHNCHHYRSKPQITVTVFNGNSTIHFNLSFFFSTPR